MEKKILYVDMDNVLVNFQSGIDQLSEECKKMYEGSMDNVPGIFALMEPMEDAIECYKELSLHFDTYILSTSPWENPTAASDKVAWVKKHLEPQAHKRLILTHKKNLVIKGILIDDRPDKNGVDKFDGEVIHFGSAKFPDWKSVREYLLDSK